MGTSSSKATFLSYEDALKRVSDTELKRLREAFKRSAVSGCLPRNIFIREILGDGVPPKLGEQMYQAFGGNTKGVSFKELVSGLVVLTRGRQDEKLKFIFGLYTSETLHLQKEVVDSLVLSAEGHVPESLSELFYKSDKVDFDTFKSWIANHPDFTSISKWLLQEPCLVTLTDDNETPTFYQTLAGVTHLTEADILELEKRYWALKGQSVTGYFDCNTLRPMVSPPIPESLAQGVFYAFDENRDNHIDFKEMACGISACCRGPVAERQKFCFKIFDKDQDGLLSKSELSDMIDAFLTVRQQSKSEEDWDKDIFWNTNPDIIVTEILDQHDADKDDHITVDEYVMWSVSHQLPEDFLSLLFEICHIVLGLKPATRQEEGKVVRGWLAREERRGLALGQTWYLVEMRWWRAWIDYISSKTFPLHPGHAQRTLASGGGNASEGSVYFNATGGPSPKGYDIVDVDEYGVIVTENYGADDPGTSASHHRSSSLPRNGTVPNGSVRKISQGTFSTPTSPSRSPRLPKARTGTIGIAQKPSSIDNSSLVSINAFKVGTLTNEGGRLKKDTMLVRGRDFELVPDAVWKALSAWYGGSPALPRSVIISTHDDAAEIELYPRLVRLLRHQLPNQRTPASTSTFTGMMSGVGGMALNTIGIHSNPTTPRRYLAYIACFSRQHTLRQINDFLCSRLRICREDMRLWKFKDEQNMTLLEDEDITMESLDIEDNSQLLIEVRNRDLTWPEELSQLAKNKDQPKKTITTQRGATGLNNLGNTCFMNSAMQCVSNTKPMTAYFTGGMHLYELNRENPLGMKGHIAQRYGDLVKDLWSGTSKTVAPLKLRWTIGKYAPRFNGFQQHDSQEFLAFLLDGLHEDLNRVHNKPYVELKDSDGRADEEVANESWENHLLRNKSIVVDLFHGQLKSQVRCMECCHVSVRFDPFTYLSLPLPMESCIHLELIVIKLDGSVPIKYGIRLNMDEKYKSLKKQLSDLSGIPAEQLLLIELFGATIKSIPSDNQKMKTTMSIGNLYAYELAPAPQIRPMTVLEECENKSTTSLALIQRSSNTHLTSGLTNGEPAATLPPVDKPEMETGEEASSVSKPNGSAVTPCRQPCDTNSETSSMNNGSIAVVPLENFNGFVVAMHRKMMRMDMYFLSSQKTRPSLFGTPLVLPCFEEITHQDLYVSVWTQVSRLVSPLPPSETNSPNHAQDCDDSLGYEYPFTLKVVQKDGFTCAHCPWYRFCRGCRLDCSMQPFNFNSSFIAIDWEPTALHLRYQTSQERAFEDHSSVTESRRMQSEPIDLTDCLKAFTTEEELGEDELYYCSKCKEHRLAAKKLDIWRLPPVLIIHLKRFQFLNGRWVKSRKIVKFPRGQFDPAEYLAPRMPKSKRIEEIVRRSNNELDAEMASPGTTPVEECVANGLPRSSSAKTVTFDVSQNKTLAKEDSRPEDIFLEDSARKKLAVRNKSDSLAARRSRTISVDSCDYSNTTYDLYALSCHTGILGGGHYVSYGKNPNEKWYCYNDSSCKEAKEDDIDTDSAYILFYERNDWDYSKIIPDVSGKEPDLSDIDDDYESEFKKHCIIQ